MISNKKKTEVWNDLFYSASSFLRKLLSLCENDDNSWKSKSLSKSRPPGILFVFNYLCWSQLQLPLPLIVFATAVRNACLSCISQSKLFRVAHLKDRFTLILRPNIFAPFHDLITYFPSSLILISLWKIVSNANKKWVCFMAISFVKLLNKITREYFFLTFSPRWSGDVCQWFSVQWLEYP